MVDLQICFFFLLAMKMNLNKVNMSFCHETISGV